MDFKISLGRTIVLVKDYDEAYNFYHRVFGCHKIYDDTAPDGQRYLHVGFGGVENTGIWFLKVSSESESKVGNQTGGEPLLVLYTDDIFPLFDHLIGEGVEITEEIVISPKSKFFHCRDLYGNRIVVVELA